MTATTGFLTESSVDMFSDQELKYKDEQKYREFNVYLGFVYTITKLFFIPNR